METIVIWLPRHCSTLLVFVFQQKEDADRFYEVLPKRLKRFGLQLHPDKTRVMESGKYAAIRAAKQGKRLACYQFLGFMCYWGKTKSGFWRLKYASRGDRLRAKLKGLHKYLWENRNGDSNLILRQVVRVVRGWINYHGISDNHGRVWRFTDRCKRMLLSWFNHRGGKRRMNWERLNHILREINFPCKWKTQSMFPGLLKQA